MDDTNNLKKMQVCHNRDGIKIPQMWIHADIQCRLTQHCQNKNLTKDDTQSAEKCTSDTTVLE